jgi:hypothetical protein
MSKVRRDKRTLKTLNIDLVLLALEVELENQKEYQEEGLCPYSTNMLMDIKRLYPENKAIQNKLSMIYEQYELNQEILNTAI